MGNRTGMKDFTDESLKILAKEKVYNQGNLDSTRGTEALYGMNSATTIDKMLEPKKKLG
jgi:hypothetical protein